MNKFISVILPVYNVSSYLRECIDSILNQTYPYYEIILVDDGSKDDSGVICDEYALKDARIRVIHKENGGLSSARNAGIEVAQYELLSFIDSDDSVDSRFLEKLVQPFNESEEIKISCCQYVKSTESKAEATNSEVKLLSSEDLLCMIYEDEIHNLSFVTWNKLYHKSLFTDIRYPVGRLYEDEFTTYKLIFLAQKCAVVFEQLYIYRIRENSIMTSSRKRGVDCLRAVRESMKFYEECGNQKLMLKAAYCYLVSCIGLLKNIEPKKDRDEERKAFKQIARRYAFQLDCSLLKKIYLKFFCIFY